MKYKLAGNGQALFQNKRRILLHPVLWRLIAIFRMSQLLLLLLAASAYCYDVFYIWNSPNMTYDLDSILRDYIGFIWYIYVVLILYIGKFNHILTTFVWKPQETLKNSHRGAADIYTQMFAFFSHPFCFLIKKTPTTPENCQARVFLWEAQSPLHFLPQNVIKNVG